MAVNGSEIQAISDLQPGKRVQACIRPDEIILALRSDKTSARNAFAGNITRVVPSGPLAHVHLDCGFPLVVLITVKSAQEMGLGIGTPVHASFKATRVHVIPRE
jgi:tungstate transport system ATP-binding protein